MLASRPRFVLIAECDQSEQPVWRFALHGAEGDSTIAACDEEPGAGPERLALLAVVRGLEALDQPSDVSLVTQSKTVLRGMRNGLDAWRNNHWRWERFGRLEPIRNADLWRRIDRALSIHSVSCRSWRGDGAPAADSSVAACQPRDARPGDSPAMIVLPTKRSRRTVCLAPRSEPLAAAG